jgi:sulfite reductase alpha subunit-like flavoprotein
MVGPGTGVTPFLGFLEHRAAKRAAHERAGVAVCSGSWRRGVRAACLREEAAFHAPLALGDARLFFGNRDPEIDFLFREEFEGFLASGVLNKLHLAWSRVPPRAAAGAAAGGGAALSAGGNGVPPPAPGTPPGKDYVQTRLLEEGATVADLLLRRGAHLYVCGDGSAMAVAVRATLALVLERFGGEGGAPLPGGAAAAGETLKELVRAGRYVEDIWS